MRLRESMGDGTRDPRIIDLGTSYLPAGYILSAKRWKQRYLPSERRRGP